MRSVRLRFVRMLALAGLAVLLCGADFRTHEGMASAATPTAPSTSPARVAAFAGVIVDVSGPVTSGGQLISDHQAAGIAFTVTQPFINVRISVGTAASPMIVIGAVGTLFVARNLGPTATAADIIATKPITSSPTLFIDGLNLSPGAYYFVIAVNTGAVGWPGSFSPIVTTNPAAVDGLDFFSSATGASALTANYAATSGIGALLYNVSGDAPTPTLATSWGAVKARYRF